jgi:hypothetical protein
MDKQVEQLMLIGDVEFHLADLPKRDHIFAAKMLKVWDRYGRLSDRQEAVVRAILQRAGVAA